MKSGVTACLLIFAPLMMAAKLEPGTDIVIGQCAALDGPAKGLGIGMRDGLKAAFEAANAKGGVHGHKMRLESRDDGYEPDRTVDCTVNLIEKDKVFALAGYVGTPTAKVAIPIVQEMKIPLIGAFTGAGVLPGVTTVVGGGAC